MKKNESPEAYYVGEASEKTLNQKQGMSDQEQRMSEDFELQTKEVVNEEEKEKIWEYIIDRIDCIIDEIPSNSKMGIDEREKVCLEHSEELRSFIENLRKRLDMIITGKELFNFRQEMIQKIGNRVAKFDKKTVEFMRENARSDKDAVNIVNDYDKNRKEGK
jgi:hypothetical protein